MFSIGSENNSYHTTYFLSFLNQFVFRNPILHIDAIYQMTAAGKQYAKNCELARGKAKEIIRERRATLQDNVSAKTCCLQFSHHVLYGVLCLDGSS